MSLTAIETARIRDLAARLGDDFHAAYDHGSREFQGAAGAERLLRPDRGLTRSNVDEIFATLAVAEEQAAAASAQRVMPQADGDGGDQADPMTPVYRQMAEDAAAAAAHRASPTGLAERQIELLEKIVALLDRRP